MKKVLVVDDDIDIHNILGHVITPHFEVFKVTNLLEAEKTLKEKVIDLLVLDEVLPDGSGIELCSKVRNELNQVGLPIIMLTKRKDLRDKLMAFNNGADDYIIKPFEPLELLARINARLKNSDLVIKEGSRIERGDLILDLTTQSVERFGEDDSEKIVLTPIEFKILYFLAKDSKAIRNRSEILDSVWGDDQHVVERTVDQHISKLRKKTRIKSFYD